MILKEIQLGNVRSYMELQPFRFPEGTSLLYGGVGSGKSSLLYAIEFALFGLGELKGADLLRNGATEGFVSLTFQEDGTDYVVHRELHRSKGQVSQSSGIIIENGESHSYDSVTEMKLRVLEILKLNEKPETKTSSVIYRYGIFTPQEEIKRIMEASPEGRLETLRRAFRLEKYATARDNARALFNHLGRVEIRVLEEQTKALDEKKAKRDSLVKEIKTNSHMIGQLEKELREINNVLGKLRTNERAGEETLQEIRGCQAQIPLIEEQCDLDARTISELKGELIESEQKRSKLTSELKKLESLPRPTDRSEEELEAELREVEEKQRTLVGQRGATTNTLSTYEMLIDKRVCPTCERPIEDASVYRAKRDKLRQEVTDSTIAGKEMERRKQSLTSLLKGLNEYDAQLEKLPWLQEGIEGQTKDIKKKAGEIQQVEARLSRSQKKLRQMKEIVKPSEKLLKALGETKQQIGIQTDLAQQKNTEKALLGQTNSRLEDDRTQLEGEISKGESALVRIDFYHEIIKYLDQYLIPTIGRIETMVLQKIHEDFNDAFQKCFSTIIGFTEIEAYVDEDFSVVIVQGGYEMPYYRLSGGERTSLALAYRLALNRLIRRLSRIGRGLLILDEPTEGLSYTQVLNLREVFDDLDCNQIVLVSHEPQFLGFSDRVFRVDKVNHASAISPL